MYPPSFSGAWAKIERAKEHRNTLEDHIANAFQGNANRPRIGIKFDLAAGEHQAYINYVPDFDRPIVRASAILGDVIQNLRNALNLVCFELALGRLGGTFPTPARENRVQFPIEDCRPRFIRRCRPKKGKDREGWIADLRPRDWAIIYSFQPCSRTHRLFRHPFDELRELSNADKHKRLTKIVIPADPIEFCCAELQAIIYHHTQRRLKIPPVEVNAVLFQASVPGLSEAEVEVAGYITPEIALTNGRAVIKTVDEIMVRVVQFVSEYQPPL